MSQRALVSGAQDGAGCTMRFILLGHISTSDHRAGGLEAESASANTLATTGELIVFSYRLSPLFALGTGHKTVGWVGV
jgi:hypothetical protein